MHLAPPTTDKFSRLLTLVTTLLIVATLYLARVVLIPIALAMLLCFLLAPVVNRLERYGLRRVPSVIIVSIVMSALLGAVTYIAVIEVISLAESLPQYRHNIREKARVLARPGMFSQASESIRSVTQEAINATTQPDDPATRPSIEGASTSASTLPGAAPRPLPNPPFDTVSPAVASPAESQPTRVDVVDPAPNAFESLASTLGPLFGPLGTAAIVIVFLIFMLIQREDLRDRLIALTSTTQLNVASQAIDDAAERVSRYLLMQFIVNVTYGIPVAIGLMLIGVPNAVLWGLLCMMFRYIPYVGPWIGAAMPTMLALAVFDGWTRPLMVIGMFVVLELISNNVVEPLLYGKGTGLSAMAVLVSAVFWAWLWGAPGLVLATPLTVCLVVLGRYLPQMEWLAVLLGDQPALPPPAKVYQRLLALDHEETFEFAQEQLKDHTLAQFYDDVLVPALNLSEHDRHAGTLDAEREQSVLLGMRALIDELGEHRDHVQGDDAKGEREAAPPRAAVIDPKQPPILLVAARDDADELAALMLSQLLAREGQRSEILPAGTLATEIADSAAKLEPPLICVSAMPPMAVAQARYVCKRLRERLPKTRIVVGLWNASDPERASERIASTGVEAVVTTFSQALEKLRR